MRNFFTLLFLLLVIGTDGYAKSGNEGTTIVWGFSEYEPFKYKDGNQYRGIDVMIVEKVAKKLGLSVKYVDCPFARCLHLLESGQIDIVSSFGMRDERKEFASYVDPPYFTKNAKAFYTRKDSDVKINKYEDVYKYKIGVKRGVKYFPQFDQDQKVDRDVADSVLLNIRKLAEGRVDAILNTDIQMDFLLIKHGYDGQFVKAPYKVELGRDFIGISKKSWLMNRKDEVDAVVKKMVESGEIVEIIEQFFVDVKKAAASVKP